MYTTVCAQCGKQAEIPFEPRADRPVYCSDCYSSIKPKR
jgi:CxxC-x17-CxxC domain-containing protein